MADPHGAVAGVSSLDVVACPIATRCVAMGTDVSGNGKSALVETGNMSATAWSGSLATFLPQGIACAMPTTCVAVGIGHSVRVDVANGAAAIASNVPAPSGELAAIDRIACPSASECFAVGFMGTEGHSKALVVHLSATGALVGTSEEPGTSGIGAIACPTATECLMAVANLKNPERIQLLSNGHFGSSHVFPSKTYIQAISCYKTAACFALAGRSTGASKTNLLYELDPLSGAITSVHTIGGGFSADSIACPTATRCLIIGFTGARPALVTATRGVPTAPRVVGGQALSDVGCTDANVCIGVGQTSTEGFVERV